MEAEGVSGIFQDTAIPLLFNVEASFSGRTIQADEQGFPHLTFDLYLSDRSNIIPSGLNEGEVLVVSQNTVLDEETETSLGGELVDGSQYTVAGTTEVIIPPEFCDASESRYLCVKYELTRPLEPPFRESDTNNDARCFEVTQLLLCTNGKHTCTQYSYSEKCTFELFIHAYCSIHVGLGVTEGRIKLFVHVHLDFSYCMHGMCGVGNYES